VAPALAHQGGLADGGASVARTPVDVRHATCGSGKARSMTRTVRHCPNLELFASGFRQPLAGVGEHVLEEAADSPVADQEDTVEEDVPMLAGGL